MAIFYSHKLKIIFSKAQSFSTTSTHPGMQRRHTVRVLLSNIPISRLRANLSTQDVEDLPVYNPPQQIPSYKTQPGMYE